MWCPHQGLAQIEAEGANYNQSFGLVFKICISYWCRSCHYNWKATRENEKEETTKVDWGGWREKVWLWKSNWQWRRRS